MTEVQTTPRAKNADELVTLFSGEIWRYVASQISRKEDAEDVVMEVFAAAFAAFHKVERADDQRLWLLAVARKKVADTIRRKYRRAETSYADHHDTPGASMFDETQIATQTALAKLPEVERQVLILKYVNGLSTDEVGVVIRRSSAATNSLLQRARQNMRQVLGGQFVETSGETL